MTTLEIVLLFVLILFVVLAVMGHGAAYRNGVTDGYGYSREPSCPGYRDAGEYLTKHMAHRWPELEDSRRWCGCPTCNKWLESQSTKPRGKPNG